MITNSAISTKKSRSFLYTDLGGDKWSMNGMQMFSLW